MSINTVIKISINIKTMKMIDKIITIKKERNELNMKNTIRRNIKERLETVTKFVDLNLNNEMKDVDMDIVVAQSVKTQLEQLIIDIDHMVEK